MKRIEFSEMTNRLHRNAVGAAAVIISIKLFNLQIDKAGTLGIEVKNFTTSALVAILFIVMAYHFVAFAIRALEEYRVWELELTQQNTTFADGGLGVVDLTNQIRKASDSLQKIMANAGVITSQGQSIFTKQDADNLKEFSKAAEIYGKRLKNFPRLTAVRFWIWDVGTAALMVLVGTLYAWSLLPSGHELFCP
ncbi:hypothetical protein [Bradyrhizobium sp. HKCCYLS20291]|uniref:hypothetical protein n=1 Tax=Bradyrhizobium sp. HKCCYLS20291 TaxID=3420766 RepID=UPI003EB9EDF1